MSIKSGQKFSDLNFFSFVLSFSQACTSGAMRSVRAGAILLTLLLCLVCGVQLAFAADESSAQADGFAQVVESSQLSGPQAPLSGWYTTTLQAGVKSITAIAHSGDGRVFAGVEGGGLRIYAPDANGLYTWQNPPAGGPANLIVSALAVYRNQLWIGTNGAGISILDLSSNSWSSFTTSNSPLPNNTVNRLTVLERANDPDDIWISTAGGAARFRTPPDAGSGNWKVLTTANGLPSNNIYDVAPWEFGNISYAYIGTDSGVRLYNGSTLTAVGGNASCLFDRATRILVDKTNLVWFVAEIYIPALAADASVTASPAAGVWSPIGVCRYAFSIVGSTWTKLASPTLPWPSNNITDMSNDDAGRVWLSFRKPNNNASSGAAAFDRDHWLVLKAPTSPMLTNDLSVVQAIGDDVWFGYTGASVFSIYSPNWNYFSQAKLGLSAAPSAILLEASQTWVGGGTQISKWDGSNWQTSNVPSNSAVSALTRGSDGNLWIGTANDGLWQLDSANSFSQQSTTDGLGDNRIRALHSDASGRLWVATQGGLSLRGNNSWLAFTTDNSGLTSNDLTALTSDATGRIWIGTAANGIAIYDPQGNPAWSRQTVTEGLPSNAIHALASDPTGSIWVATDGGVAKWDAQSATWSSFTTNEGLPSNTILSITADPSGVIWAGTAQGLARGQQNGWQAWHVTGSFIGSDQPVALAADESRLWAVAGSQVAVRYTLIDPIGNKPPVINSITPENGAPDDVIAIDGSNFDGRGANYNEVRFCCANGQSGTPAPKAYVINATATHLTVFVPAQAQTGKIILKTVDGQSESVTDFTVNPTISKLSTTCTSPGSQIAIYGSGFLSSGGAPAYITIGGGQERLADVTTSTVISTFIRAGDTSGTVKLRLGNDQTTSSSQILTVGVPKVDKIAVQQGIEGQQNIWGKRTLVQVTLVTPGDCSSVVNGGRLLWKLKDGSTRMGGTAYFSSPNGLISDKNSQPVSLVSAVNFVAEYGTGRSGFSEPFPLSQFAGVQLVLRNGFVDLLTVDVPPSAFNYIDLGTNRQFRVMMVTSTAVTNTTTYATFWKDARNNMMQAARIYPQADISPLFGPNVWMGWTPIWIDVGQPISFTLDYGDEAEDVIDQVDDYLDPSGDTYGVALIDPAAIQPGGDAAGLSIGGQTALVTNNPSAGGKTFMHEAMHNFGAVDSDQANYLSNYGAHSRYDEGQWFDDDAADDGLSNCENDLTFRQALKDEVGGIRRTVHLDSGDPIQLSNAGCGGWDKAKSLLSYAPQRNNTNVFLEPLDYKFAINDLKALAQVQAVAAGVQTSDSLHLAGDIGLNNQVTLTIGYVSSEAGDFTPIDPEGYYHLQLRDSNDQLLYDQPFAMDFSGSHTHGEEDLFNHDNPPLSNAHFNLRIPFMAGVSKAEIRLFNGLIWSKTVSANAPTVNFVTPNGGSFKASDPISINWNASDADNDALLYSLEYSADNGQHWLMVEPSIETTNFTWQPLFVPSSPTALLRVRASDGFSATTSTSAPFAMAPNAPLALILEPSEVRTFTEGSTVHLVGGSVTANGLDQGEFRWSQGETLLGAQRDVSYTLNSAGNYSFTLQVSANGMTGTDVITLTVLADYDHDGMSDEWELSHKFNPLDATDAYSDTDGDDLVNLQELQWQTEPRQPDTDGDSASDGAEVNGGTDPLRAENKPAATPVLQVGAKEFNFQVNASHPTVPPQKFWVTNGGNGALSWSANSDASWLSLTPAAGSAPTEVTLQVDPAELADGIYTGTLTYSATGAASSPTTVVVKLTVTGSSVKKIYLPAIQR